MLKMYCCSDLDEKEKPKYSCKGIQKATNNITCKRFEDVLLKGVADNANNCGFRYLNGTMKTYEQNKIGLSGAYCKRIVGPNGRTTTPLEI